MPGAKYFASMMGAFILGLIALLVAGLIFLLALPLLVLLFIGVAALVIAFIIIFVIVYVCMFIGIAIYYAIRHPMEVETKKDKKYSISKTRESGMREKGSTKPQKARKAR
jgi:hypothetical protein